MAKAKKTKSGMWTCLVFVGKDDVGKRKYRRFTESSKREAEYQAAEYARNHRKPNCADNMKFSEAAEDYVKAKENLLSPSTIRGYRGMIRTAFPLLKDIILREIDSGDYIQRQINANAKCYSAKSIKNQFGMITAVMGYYGYMINKRSVTLKPKEKHSIPVPTQQEAEKLMAVAHQDPAIECQILLAITCSLRQSEIADLNVEDIEGNIVHVRGATVRGEHGLIHKETNKSLAGTRDVPMPKNLSQLMQERCEQRKTGKLFPLHPANVLKHLNKLEDANGLPHYTMHSLRHCFAATMHAHGVPDKYIMEMGGWSSADVLKNVYEYTFADKAKSEKAKVDSYFDSVINPDSIK